METLLFVVSAIITYMIILLVENFTKLYYDKIKSKDEQDYNNGYQFAIESMLEGEKPQEIINDLNHYEGDVITQWDKGCIDACEEYMQRSITMDLN